MGRVNNRRVLIYAGNSNGLIAYGIGRGKDYKTAYNNSNRELKKNIIQIPHDPQFTNPAPLKSRFNDYRITVQCKGNPSVWGNPIMILMVKYAVSIIQWFYD